MAGVAGAKNTYGTGVKLGNWVEDSWGSYHARRLAEAPPTMTGTTSEYRSHYSEAPSMADRARPVQAPLDTLADGHLVFAHGTDICNRAAPATHYMTMTQATFRGASTNAALNATVDGATAAPRTELTRKKALMRAAGVDPWDPQPVQATLATPGATVGAPSVPSLAPVPTASTAPAQRFATLAEASLSATAALAQASGAAAGGDRSHGRSMSFTRSFHKGIP